METKINDGKRYASVERPWLKYYNDKVHNASVPKLTAYQYMALENSDNLDTYAIEYHGYRETYKEFFASIAVVAQSFYNLGIREGDVVTIDSITTPELIKSFYALNRIGAILNLVDVRSDSKSLKHYIEESNSKYVIIMDNFIEELNKIIYQTDVDKVITYSPYNSLSSFKKKIVNIKELFSNKKGSKIINNIKKSDIYIEWNEMINIPVIKKVEYVSYKENMEAVYVHTGGTTGKPKTVRLSNENLNAIALQYKLFDGQFNKGDRFLDDMMPFIAYGIVAQIHMPLCLGLINIINCTLEPSEFTRIMIKVKPNHVLAVPTYWEDFSKNKKVNKMDLSFLKHAGSGGDTIGVYKKQIINDFFKNHNSSAVIEEGYGMTELSSTAVICIGSICLGDSVGIPLGLTTVSVFEPNTENEIEYINKNVGEICITGPGMMLGYLNNKEEEEIVVKIHKDGTKWVHTGDLGYIDDDGYIHLVGRIKRMIMRGGYKIYPVQMENIISSIKGVAKCCVVGAHSETYGSLPVAYVLLDKSSINEKELIKQQIIDACKNSLAAYSQPNNIIFRDSLPLTGIGKVDYKKLEQEHSKEFDNKNNI